MRESVRFHDHLGGGASESVYGEMEPKRAADMARQSVEAGFDALKLLAVPRSRPLESAARVASAADVMAAVRDAAGPDVDVMVDLHGRTTATMALGIEVDESVADAHPYQQEPQYRRFHEDGSVAEW